MSCMNDLSVSTWFQSFQWFQPFQSRKKLKDFPHPSLPNDLNDWNR